MISGMVKPRMRTAFATMGVTVPSTGQYRFTAMSRLSDRALYRCDFMATLRSSMRLRYEENMSAMTATKHRTTTANTPWNAVSTTDASARTFSTGMTLHTYQLPSPTGATHT